MFFNKNKHILWRHKTMSPLSWWEQKCNVASFFFKKFLLFQSLRFHYLKLIGFPQDQNNLFSNFLVFSPPKFPNSSLPIVSPPVYLSRKCYHHGNAIKMLELVAKKIYVSYENFFVEGEKKLLSSSNSVLEVFFGKS